MNYRWYSNLLFQKWKEGMVKTINVKISAPGNEYPYQKTFPAETLLVEFKVGWSRWLRGEEAFKRDFNWQLIIQLTLCFSDGSNWLLVFTQLR